MRVEYPRHGRVRTARNDGDPAAASPSKHEAAMSHTLTSQIWLLSTVPDSSWKLELLGDSDHHQRLPYIQHRLLEESRNHTCLDTLIEPVCLFLLAENERVDVKRRSTDTNFIFGLLTESRPNNTKKAAACRRQVSRFMGLLGFSFFFTHGGGGCPSYESAAHGTVSKVTSLK